MSLLDRSCALNDPNRNGRKIMEEQMYTYDLQVIFNGTGDDMHIMEYKSYFDNLDDVMADILSQISINIHPKDVK